jgi:predicted nucleic acid-binding protein
MIVILDSSVWVKEDIHHGEAVEIVEGLGRADAALIIPDIVFAETTNVLMRIDPSDRLVLDFQLYLLDYDWFVQTVFGTREFWTKTVEHVAHLVRLKTLDLLVVSYTYHFQGDDFKSFDTQQQKTARKILKR